MPFIAAGIVGAVGLAGTTAGAIVGGLINVGIAGGLAYASSALSGKTGATTQTGVQTDVEMGGGVARGGTFGRCGVAGYLAYVNTFAANNNMLDMAYLLGDGPHDGLGRVWVGGKAHAVTRTGGDAYRTDYRVEGIIGATGISYLAIVLWHGYSDQPASATLISGANPAGRWTAQDRLAGVCYAHVRGLYDEEAFPNGIPQIVFELRGRRLYDWRKDSTAGGSGAHRWADEKTWEFSENPFVQLYNYQRGTWLGGELTVGMGVAPVDLAPDAWTAAANACDELVGESDGSTAPRYRCGTYVAADEEHAAVIQRFLDACGGALYESVGAYSPQAGVAQIVTYPTITDGDLVSGRPVRFAARRPRAELTNGVFGSFSDPKQQYELMAYAARTSAAAEAADGEIIRVQVDYPSVHHGLQAQRLANMQLGLARLQATATITLGFSAVVLEPGDWLRWQSARFGLRTWLITSLTHHADQTVSLTLREIGSAAYAWSEADEGTVSVGGVPPDPPALINTVPLMGVAATSLVANDGNRQPALRITWAPILDATVDTIQIGYRVKGGTGAVLTASSAAPNSGELLISAGVQGKTTYEVQGTITTTPKRTTVWTAWAEVTTGDLTATPGPGVITVEMMQAGLREQVEVEGRQSAADLQGIADSLALAVANVAAAAKLKSDKVWEASKTEVERMGVRVGSAEASIDQVRTVSASATASLAEEVKTVKATADSAATIGGQNAAKIGEVETAFVDANTSLTQRSTALESAVGKKPDGTLVSISTTYATQAALATAQNSTSSRIDGVESAMGDVAASVTVTSMSMAAPSGFSAAWQVAVKGTAGAAVYGSLMMATKGSGASATSWTLLRADRLVMQDGLGLQDLFSINASTGRAYWNVNIIAPGSITAGHMTVGSLAAITTQTGSLDVTGIMTVGTKIQLNGPAGYILGWDSMANQTLMGWFDNAPRLRVARPNYNVLDAGLTGEQIAFDSSRQDTLRVFAAKFNTADTARVNMTVNFGGNSVNRATAEYSFGQTLPFIPLVMAWTHDGNVHYPAYCYVYNDKIRIDYWGSQSTTKPNVSFIIFYNPMQSYRAEESAITGIPRWCLGAHPTFGAGLHISRRGVNILSATALDLIFSTSFPMLQIDQAGRANLLLQLMNSNPMQYDLTATVNLARARPDRPPVIAGVSSYGKNLTTISSFTMVTWTSDTSFIIRVGRWAANEYPDLPVTVDWALPKYDASYPVGQTSTVPTPRWMFSGAGLKVSKANVDVRTASGDGLLFDPSLSMLNVQARGEIVRAGAENRLINVPVNTSGHPIVVYGNQVGGSVIGSMHGYLNGALPNPGGTPAAIASPALVYMESPTEMRYRASVSSPYANIWWSALNFSKY